MNKIHILENGLSAEFLKDLGKNYSLKDIEGWLKSKNILGSKSILNLYKDDVKWHRSGGETYLSTCILEYSVDDETVTKKIVFKALVGIFPERQLKTWARKRQELARSGIPVVHWYNTFSGLIVEDYYLNLQSDSEVEIDFFTSKLESIGYFSLNLKNDLRQDEYGFVFYGDFGHDLIKNK